MPVTLGRNNRFAIPPPIGRTEGAFADETIFVVPTKRRIRYLTREFLASREQVSELPLFTLETLANRVFEVAFEQLRLVQEPVRTLLFSQAIDRSRDSITYFYIRDRYNTLSRGTLDKVIHVIEHLKEYGITPQQLFEELASEEDEDKPKLRDIANIYAAYEDILASLDSVDAEGVFTALHLSCSQSKFESAFRRVFPHAQQVSIVGFDEFTEPELGFIKKISRLDIDVSVVFDYQHGNDGLFGHLTENYKRFQEMGFRERTEYAAESAVLLRQQSSEAIQHVARNLFRHDAPSAKVNCSGSITVMRAKDRVSEVEAICKIIKQMKADHPSLDLSRVCVAMYKPQAYTHLMREQFKKYGVPANITDRFPLAQSPVVAAIIGLLEVAVRGFRREDVLRTVGTAYFSFSNNGVPLDAANLMNVARELRIVRGPQTWIAKCEQAIRKLRADGMLSDNDEEKAQTERRIAAFKKTQDDMLWLESILADIAREQTPTQFLARLHALLDRLAISQRIISIGTTLHAELLEQDARALAAFLDVAEQTARLLEYQDGREQRYSLRFFVEQLRVAVSQERYNVREQFGQGVLVTSIDETRGLPLDVMIVAGLVDGEFPSVYQSELFFGGRRTKEREQRHSWENRYLFYQAITNWSTHLYLTYPEQEAELDLVRSGFIEALLKIVEVEYWTYPGTTPFEQTIYAKQDFFRFQGASMRAGSSQPSARIPAPLRHQVDHIQRALEVESSRIDLHTLPEFEGVIARAVSGEARNQLQQLRHRVYSVSQLESYGKCPYKFFAQRVLRLRGAEDVEEEFSPMDKGSLLHEILFEFFTERREKSLPSLIACADEEFEIAYRQLLGIAERRLAEIDITDAFWDLEKELILGDKQGRQGLLREFLEFERARSTSLLPEFFEVGFGSQLGARTRIDRTFSSEEPILAGAVQLRGKVDRVETNERIFAIIDYKTAKDLPKLEDIRSGISLQLPLYLYTIERLLAEKQQRNLRPAGGAYYQVRSPVALKVGVASDTYRQEFVTGRSTTNFLPSDQDLHDLIEESIKTVNKYVEEMTQGSFPLTTHEKIDKVCVYCDYKTICRIQTVRRVKKAKPEDS